MVEFEEGEGEGEGRDERRGIELSLHTNIGWRTVCIWTGRVLPQAYKSTESSFDT